MRPSGARDLSRVTNVSPRARRFVVEENAAARVHAVRLAVVHRRTKWPNYLRAGVRAIAGENGVFSVCGTSCTLPNISDELAW